MMDVVFAETGVPTWEGQDTVEGFHSLELRGWMVVIASVVCVFPSPPRARDGSPAEICIQAQALHCGQTPRSRSRVTVDQDTWLSG